MSRHLRETRCCTRPSMLMARLGSVCTISRAHSSRRSQSSGAVALNSSTSRPAPPPPAAGTLRRAHRRRRNGCLVPRAPAVTAGASASAEFTVMRSSAKSILSTRLSACASSIPTWAPTKGCSRVFRIMRSSARIGSWRGSPAISTKPIVTFGWGDSCGTTVARLASTRRPVSMSDSRQLGSYSDRPRASGDRVQKNISDSRFRGNERWTDQR